MNKRVFALLLVAAMGVFGGSMAEAKSANFHNLGEFTAGGGPKKFSVDKKACSVIRVKCTDGSIIVNSIIYWVAGQKNPIKVGERIDKGEYKDFTIGDDVKVTDILVSDDGKGTYIVEAK